MGTRRRLDQVLQSSVRQYHDRFRDDLVHALVWFRQHCGWEVVVKHEVYELIAEKTVDALLVLLGSKRTGYDRLCFTAGESELPCAWEKSGLSFDITDIGWSTAVDSAVLFDHSLANQVVLEVTDD